MGPLQEAAAHNQELAKLDLSFALSLCLIQSFLHGDGAFSCCSQLLSDDVAHQSVVLDDGRHDQIVQALEHCFTVIGMSS